MESKEPFADRLDPGLSNLWRLEGDTITLLCAANLRSHSARSPGLVWSRGSIFASRVISETNSAELDYRLEWTKDGDLIHFEGLEK